MTVLQFQLDGLGDPRAAEGLTKALRDDAGLTSRCDPAGEWLEVELGDDALTAESTATAVRRSARLFGLLVVDRIGRSYDAQVSRAPLRQILRKRWFLAFAWSLVLGLPALIFHYAGDTPILRALEALFAVLTVALAGRHILQQGFLSAVFLRATPDLLTTIIVVIALLVGIGQFLPGVGADLLHAAVLAIICSALQRLIIARRREKLDGGAAAMLPTGRITSMLLLGTLAVAAFVGPGVALALALCMPPSLAHLSINRHMPGPVALLPVIGFATVLIALPGIYDPALAEVRVEAAALFQLVFTLAAGCILGSSASHE